MLTISIILIMSTFLLTSCNKTQYSYSNTATPTTERAESQEDSESVMTRQDQKTIAQDAKIGNDATETAGVYIDYSVSSVESALASDKKVVLFFYAPWCPSCKFADTNLSKEKIPPNIVIFKTDYDSNIELRKKYGVTYQHTFVSIKSD